jgi:hypothetical protein
MTIPATNASMRVVDNIKPPEFETKKQHCQYGKFRRRGKKVYQQAAHQLEHLPIIYV